MIKFLSLGGDSLSKTDIRGLKIDNITMSEAVLMTENALEKGKKTVVFTPNAEIAQACSEDESIMKIISSADILLPDGAGILKAAKILGTPLREKVAGVDYGENVARMCAEKGYSLFILGGKPTVAEKAAENLRGRYPGLKIAGCRDGYFDKSPEGSEAVVNEINTAKADVLYVCLGFPAQEKWAMENTARLSPLVIACLGGSVDIYAGTAKRAPKLFISLHLEWLWRLIKQPSRIGRMMALPKYIIETKKYKRRKQKNSV